MKKSATFSSFLGAAAPHAGLQNQGDFLRSEIVEPAGLSVGAAAGRGVSPGLRFPACSPDSAALHARRFLYFGCRRVPGFVVSHSSAKSVKKQVLRLRCASLRRMGRPGLRSWIRAGEPAQPLMLVWCLRSSFEKKRGAAAGPSTPQAAKNAACSTKDDSSG
jgi:hypothetical protein